MRKGRAREMDLVDVDFCLTGILGMLDMWAAKTQRSRAPRPTKLEAKAALKPRLISRLTWPT